ncbi:MAG: polysaccharide biosynthesis tyrosine autokinase [Jatrophihabitantaceae bacterium]
MTLRNYLRALREHALLVAVFTVLATALAVVVTGLTPKVYQASAQVFVNSNGNSDPLAQYQAAAFVQAQVATYAQIVDSPQVLDAVRRDLNLAISNPALKAKITATTPTQSTLINVYATDGSSAQAAAIANSAARAFIVAIEQYSTPNGSRIPAVRLVVTDPAVAPRTPIAPNAVLNIALGAFLGLLIGFALAVARELLDNRLKDADAAAKAADAPIMGIVVEDPKTPRHPIATRAGSRSIRAENYRQLRANLQFANVDQHPRIIAITSSIPSEGKTTVAINLASTLAEAGFSVCLVDADLRRPTVAKVLGLLSPVGLTSVLIHQIELSEAMQHAGSSLYVLTSGPTPPNPSEVLASSYVRDVIRSLLDKVDYVVLDTAPLLPVADGSEVAALADGTLLVARYRETTDTHIKRGVQTLKRVDAKLLGVVMNRIPVRRNDEYGYSYYRRTEEDQPTHSRRSRLTGKLAADE